MPRGTNKPILSRFSAFTNLPTSSLRSQEHSKDKNQKVTKSIRQNGDEMIIVKGTPGHADQTFSVNLTSIRNMLQQLKDNAETQPWDHLTGKDKETFQNLKHIIHLMYQSGTYSYIQPAIKEIFNNPTPIAGTVAGFFAGCLHPTTFNGNPSCSATCAGAIPLEDGPGVVQCNNWVIFYNRDPVTQVGVFRPANQGNPDNTHIFVTQSVPDPVVFTLADIQQLRDFKVKKVHLHRYSSNGAYQEETLDFVPLESLPVMPSTIGTPTTHNAPTNTTPVGVIRDVSSGNTGGTSTLTIILIILLVILVLAVLYFMYKGNNNFTSMLKW